MHYKITMFNLTGSPPMDYRITGPTRFFLPKKYFKKNESWKTNGFTIKSVTIKSESQGRKVMPSKVEKTIWYNFKILWNNIAFKSPSFWFYKDSWFYSDNPGPQPRINTKESTFSWGLNRLILNFPCRLLTRFLWQVFWASLFSLGSCVVPPANLIL